MRYLIVVDMQNDFIDGSLGTDEAQLIVDNVCKKIEEVKAEGGVIYATLDTHGEDYLQTREGRFLPVEHCIKGTHGWQLNSKVVAALEGCAQIYEKPTFGSKKLAEDISARVNEGDTVELCGLCTDICVVSNALLIKALSPETDITVDQSCCAGVTPEKHLAALETMRSCQIEVR